MNIQNIADLASHLCAAHDTEASIAKRIFKDTSCGCPAGVDAQGFWVAGYCEGSDREHEVHRVPFPCDSDAIDKAIEQADKDGCATWNDTHGCEDCYPEGSCDEYGNEFAPGEVGGPVDPKCPTCNGDGIIM